MGRRPTPPHVRLHESSANLECSLGNCEHRGSGRDLRSGNLSVLLNSVRKGSCGESPEPLSGLGSASIPVNEIPPGYIKARRVYRAANRKALKEQLGTPVANQHEIWRVTVTSLSLMPISDHIKGNANGLSMGNDYAWLRPKEALRIVIQDRLKGGHPSVFKAEFRHCDLCARPLISTEAEQRRKMLNTPPGSRTNPCGQNCLKDRESRFWMKLAPYCDASRNRATGSAARV